jgi:hypothetical protein
MKIVTWESEGTTYSALGFDLSDPYEKWEYRECMAQEVKKVKDLLKEAKVLDGVVVFTTNKSAAPREAWFHNGKPIELLNFSKERAMHLLNHPKHPKKIEEQLKKTKWLKTIEAGCDHCGGHRWPENKQRLSLVGNIRMDEVIDRTPYASPYIEYKCEKCGESSWLTAAAVEDQSLYDLKEQTAWYSKHCKVGIKDG